VTDRLPNCNKVASDAPVLTSASLHHRKSRELIPNRIAEKFDHSVGKTSRGQFVQKIGSLAKACRVLTNRNATMIEDPGNCTGEAARPGPGTVPV
jgi:hypothetical protein